MYITQVKYSLLKSPKIALSRLKLPKIALSRNVFSANLA